MKSFFKYGFVLTIVFLLITPTWAQQIKNVTLQLKWKHQFQFAGYYAAIEKGYYQEAGLRVNLIEAVEGQNPSDAVFEGKAQFGVCTSDILLMRAQNKKAVVLATIFQHSPQIIIASKRSGIEHVQDLIGKRIALEPNAADIIAYMNDEGVSLDECIIDQHAFDANMLIDGKIDAISSYSTDEPFILKQAHFDYTILSPLMGGIDFYGEGLFTTEELIKKNPALVMGFREASLKGWKYAMENPEEIVNLIYNKYTQRHSIEHLRFEAAHMKNLIMSDVVEIGYTNSGRWESIADIYKKLKMLDPSFTTKGLLYSDYLKPTMSIPWNIIIILLLIAVISSSGTYFFYNISRKLKREIRNRKKLERNLIESEEKHRILFVNSPDAYQIIIDGVFADCNRATERMFCCDRSQVIGQSPAVLSPEYQPDGRKSSEAAQEKIREALRSGKNTFEWLHRRFDGSDFMVEVSIASMVLNGKPILFSTCRDITERKQAEDALQQSNQKLEAIISASPDGIGMVSLDGKFQLISEKLIEMYGYSIDQKEELLRRNVFDFIDPSNHKILTDNIGKLIAGEKDNKLTEYVAIKKDNGRFDIEMNSTILFDSKGNPDSFLFVERNITERKNVETLLKASEIRFKTIFNEAPLGIALIDSLTGQIIEVNPMFTIVAGRTMEELANINWMSFTHPDDIQKDLDNMALLNAGKISGFQMEKRYLLLDGTSVWINMTIASIYVEDKAHPRHLCMIENIADRKYAEEALRTSENHLNTLIQTIPDLIWLKDKNGVYLSCNKMFERFFGAKVPDIIGKTDYDFVSKELADFFRENDCKAMDAGKPNSNEEWITFADDGHRALLDTTKAPMYDSKGAIIGVLGIGHDITDRKRSEEALRESEEKLRILFDTMPNGFYRSTPEGYYVDVNPAMVKMLGYDSKEELLKAYIPTDIYVQPSERDEFQKQNIEFINKLEEYRLKTKDGRIIYIEDNARYIKDDQGEIIFHEGICRDITERKLAEEKLKANEAILKNLNADKDRFISILAHDLKSPFSTILGFLELLTENIREYDIDKIETHIGIISRAAQNTFNLLEDILVWAKSQSGKIPYRPKKLNPTDIFADVVLNMNLIAEAKNISINHFIAEGLTVYADIDMLKTILRNLISNAIKFTNNGGKIDIRIEQSGANITFSVSDNGVGIAPEIVNKLFDITQTHTTKGTANESGTGLGLMLCKDFVEKHGGTLWVESEVGKGSKFIFSLKKYDDLLLS